MKQAGFYLSLRDVPARKAHRAARRFWGRVTVACQRLLHGLFDRRADFDVHAFERFRRQRIGYDHDATLAKPAELLSTRYWLMTKVLVLQNGGHKIVECRKFGRNFVKLRAAKPFGTGTGDDDRRRLSKCRSPSRCL